MSRGASHVKTSLRGAFDDSKGSFFAPTCQWGASTKPALLLTVVLVALRQLRRGEHAEDV